MANPSPLCESLPGDRETRSSFIFRNRPERSSESRTSISGCEPAETARSGRDTSDCWKGLGPNSGTGSSLRSDSMRKSEESGEQNILEIRSSVEVSFWEVFIRVVELVLQRREIQAESVAAVDVVLCCCQVIKAGPEKRLQHESSL